MFASLQPYYFSNYFLPVLLLIKTAFNKKLGSILAA